jgi:phosphoribosylamine---glycine ligase
MKVLVIGSGGREHAICTHFSRSQRVNSLYCADGNAGIAEVAKRVEIKPDDVAGLADYAKANAIDLTFVGGEVPLALGVVDRFQAEGLRIIGPNRSAARLEASKSFSKDFMARRNIPTARFAVADSPAAAIDLLQAGEMGDEGQPVVVKADGLAAGKGVVVAPDRTAAIKAVSEMADLVGTGAAQRIVLEECLVGQEISLLMFASGAAYSLMPPVRDHKRLLDGDMGPNTGGMGTFTDDTLLTDGDLTTIRTTIVEPTLEGCIADGFPFVGILFIGLMMTDDGPKVLEYNVRFGDPETQSILVRLNTDLIDICESMLVNKLDQIAIDWNEQCSATVVLAALGYPAAPVSGDVITGIEAAKELNNVEIFHAGTASMGDGQYQTAGGRVLGITATGDGLDAALDLAYKAAGLIRFDGMQFRRDIGRTHQ